MSPFINLVASGTSDIEGEVSAFSIRAILTASLILVVLLVIASQVIGKKKHEYLKKPLFIMIASTIVLPSLFLMGSTVYINTISESGGPVHWHTDFEYWVCGQEIELRDPSAFLSNKIGTSTYHEHDDRRIHLEGVVIEKEYDASLEKFFDVTESEITSTSLVIATEDAIFEDEVDGDKPTGDQQIVRDFMVRDDEGKPTVAVENGDNCGDGVNAEVQAFLFRYNKDDDTYSQTKLAEPARYIMRDESIVPPGDCVIIEFDSPRNATDKLCKQYGVRDRDRCLEFGVSQFNPELCNIKQVVTAEGYQ